MRRPTNPSESAVRQRLSALTRSLPAAEKGDVAQLHEARVATRRLREAVLLMDHGSRTRRLERRLRRLTRALGPVRELDVSLRILDEFGDTGDVAATALRTLTRAIRAERTELHSTMRRKIDAVDVEKLRRRAMATAKKHCRAGDTKALAKARLRIAMRGAQLQTAVDHAGGLYLADRLHDVRLAIKKLRYALELHNQLTGRRGVADLRTLKNAQDLLGRMHDFEILILRIRRVQGSSDAPALRVSAELDRLVRRLERECRQLHGQYNEMRKKLVAMCEKSAASVHAPGRMARAGSAA